MSTITSTTTSATTPSTKKPIPTLTATYRNGFSASTLTFTYPLPTTSPSLPSTSNEAPPPILPALEAKTAHLKQLRELCVKLQGDLNGVLTEMMREKDLDLGEHEEEQEDDGEEGSEEKL